MEHTINKVEEQSKQDFTKSWVSSSRFLFYLKITCILSLVIGFSFGLYKHKHKSKPEFEIQGSTKYTPEYK